MIDITKQKAIFIRRPGGAPAALAAFGQALENCTTCIAVDAATFTDLAEFKKIYPPENTCLFIELDWLSEKKISYEAAWREWRVVLVKNGAVVSPENLPWTREFSCLDATSLPEDELNGALQLAVAPEKLPGIVAICRPGAEIYFEKVTRRKGLGQRLDRFQDYFETHYPGLSPQLFNLRQLVYSLMHLALETSAAASKIVPVVDFQIAAGEERIVFSTRFSAPPGILARWASEIAASENSLLKNAARCAHLLAFTELSELNQIEIKAVISGKGNFAEAGINLLFASLANFSPDPAVLAAQQKTKYFTLASLQGNEKNNLAPEAAAPPEEGEPAQAKAGMGTQLNFKLKADMLENEKANLQGLVKKKSQLISDLTKDVNRAQREVVEAQKAATKEILKMRMESEKAKNEARDAKKKLAVFQRKAAEEAESASKAKQADTAPKQDFEKDLKQAELARRNLEGQLKEQVEKAGKTDDLLQKARKEIGQLTGELNLLKQKLLQISQRAAMDAANSTGSQKSGAENEPADKIKKQFAESIGKERELEKAVKALALKLDAAEKNLRVHEQMFEKKLLTAEKSVEEAKRQKSEMVTKLEEAKTEAKRKLEEFNERERTLKKLIEQLGGVVPPAKAA